MAMTIEQQRAVAVARARMRANSQPQSAPQEQAQPWYAPITNIPRNAYDVGASFAQGAVNQGKHFFDTVDTPMGKMPLGFAGPIVSNVRDVANMGMAVGQNPKAAYDAAAAGLDKNFGTPTRAWNTIATHPVDTALMFAPGVGQAAKGAELANLGRTAGALGKVAEYSNPVNIVGKPAVKLLPNKAALPAIKTVDEMAAVKNAAYGEIKKSGMSYKPEAINGLLRNIDNTLAKNSFSPELHSKTMGVVPKLQSMHNASPTINELDQLRQVIRRDVITPDPRSADAFFGNQILKKIDKFTDNSSPSMMINGNMAKDPAKLLGEARQANVAYRKTDEINYKLNKGERAAAASGSGANQDNAIRQKINSIIDEKRGQVFKSFSPAERAKMLEIVNGTMGRNVARRIGKLAPTGIVSGGLGSSLGAGAGSFLGGPVGAAIGATAVPAFGQGAKLLADRGTRKAVDELLRIVQNGGKALPKQKRRTMNDKDLVKAFFAARATQGAQGQP